MIQVDHLSKRYGDTLAVDDLSFWVGEGEIVGLLGPNGAGKSTTMRILTCFLPATSGKASVAGHDVFSESVVVRRIVGYLPENVPLYSEMRVREYLSYRAKIKGVGRRERTARIGSAMERCDVAGVARRVIGQLSKGYRQRVGLADCLIHDPRVLILDEPTVGLDPNQIIAVRSLIKELSHERTVLLSTHYLGEVEAVCERFLIINEGRLAIEGRLDELRDDTHVELAAIGPVDEIRKALVAIAGVTTVTAEPTGDGGAAYHIGTRSGSDVRQVVFDKMVAGGWKVCELHTASRSLEDLFVQVTKDARERSWS